MMTSIKGHDSVTNKQKMTGKNLNLDLVSINANAFDLKILSHVRKMMHT